jgi:hypothetical protein
MRKFLLSSAALFMLAAPAVASDYGVIAYTPAGDNGSVPACDTPAVLRSITNRFAYQDAHIVYSGVTIASISGVRERAYKPGYPGFIDRRFCGATAWLSNGRKSEVVYMIDGRHTGFAGFGYHVQSCLPGHDPYNVYDARCRSLRP